MTVHDPSAISDQPIAMTRYLISTFAPTSSNFFLMAAASSLGIPSLIGLGAPSTRSLASLRPRLVISRTTLMTLILLPPTSVKVTVKSVFSSAGAAAPPPAPAGIAIGIAEAAETPSSDSSVFTSCESSRTVIPLMYSTTCCCVTSAILVSLFLYFALGPHPQRLCLRGSSPLGLACHDYPFSQQLRGPNPGPCAFAAHRRSALLVTTLR